MMRDNDQKIKLLKLYEMLERETDEENPLCTNTLCARLIEDHISCDRRTLSRDIDLLNERGYEVLSKFVGHEKGYYVLDRKFDNAELQILIDAVRAANFITEQKTKVFIDKIAAMGGSARTKLARRSLISFVNPKSSNEQILYNVDALRTAIQKKRKASFYYFNLNEKHERVYHHDKMRYIVEPMALIYNEDNYYLICHNTDESVKGDIRTYRVDRMESTCVEKDSISDVTVVMKNGLSRNRAAVFKMFGGAEAEITLEFDPKILGSIYDKFGETIKIRQSGDNLRVSPKLAVSPTFFGWLFQFGTLIKIVTPANVAKEYKQYMQKALSLYDDI